ncbi:MAG: transposase [Nanoarchaeota archaeon]
METITQIPRQKMIVLEKKDYLEHEKQNFLHTLNEFFDNLDERKICTNGRPPIYFKDMLKSMLIMTYHGMSYRRCQGDLEIARELGIINAIPNRSTLCKYMNEEAIRKELMVLIQQSASSFINAEATLIIDSTWYALKMYSGGHNRKPTNKNKNKDIPPLAKTRKLHLGILRNSRIIAYATTSKGTRNDNLFFKEILFKVIENGFYVRVLLADAGYMSKANYALAQEKGVENIFIDFRSNVTGKRAKSKAWGDAFYIWKHDNNYWHEIYRFRVLVEGVFSTIKRKFMNWLRTRKVIARDNEMLLKVLCYNLTILGKYLN